MNDSLQEKPIDFFISRAGSDKDVAQFIAATLEAAGYSTIIQDWDFGSKSFVRAMDDALSSAARVIAVLSAEYLGRPHCKSEWQAALQDDTTNATGRLVVFRCDNCAPQGLLGAIPYSDLAHVLHDEGRLRELVLAAVQTSKRQAPQLRTFAFGPAITNISGFAVPGFSGRERELAHMHERLWVQDGVTSPRCTLTGLGGIGKSAIAREFARRFQSSYSGIWWIAGESRASAIVSLAQLAVRLEPHLAENTDQQALASRALEQLRIWQPDRPWLLVFDNAETPAVLKDCLPEGRGAHVLITSRFQSWSEVQFGVIALGILPRDASVSILTELAGRGSTADADVLAEVLGDHALALCHAAAYLLENPLEFL